jgi:hypothetical protein
MNRFLRTLATSPFLFLALLVAISSAIAACSSWKQVVKTADDVAAQLLCAQTASATYAISVEDAVEAYCNTRDTWRPWLDAVLAARKAGAMVKAGKAATSAEALGCPVDEPAALAPAAPPSGTQSSPVAAPGAP